MCACRCKGRWGGALQGLALRKQGLTPLVLVRQQAQGLTLSSQGLKVCSLGVHTRVRAGVQDMRTKEATPRSMISFARLLVALRRPFLFLYVGEQAQMFLCHMISPEACTGPRAGGKVSIRLLSLPAGKSPAMYCQWLVA